MAGKVVFDAAQAGKLTWDPWAKHSAFCFWCLVAAGATFGMLPLVWPEARAAVGRLSGLPPVIRARRSPPMRLELEGSPRTS